MTVLEDCGARPHMYAEYLPKLQKISIVVSLPTPSERKTKVMIERDANTLHIYHDTVTTKMALPVDSDIRDEHLGFDNREINPGQTKLSWRIQPADAVTKAAEATARTGAEIFRVPWSAADLIVNVDIVCRKCRTVILSKDKLKEWKDLPSDNWAEMMEFWHCHKPTTANGDKQKNSGSYGHSEGHEQSKPSDDQLAYRGYGANSAISAQSGVGFVDLTKFLFYSEDCRGLTMDALSVEKDDKKTNMHGGMMATYCAQCGMQVGHFESRKNGFSLYKWAVNLIDSPSDTKPRFDPPNLAQCLAAALLETQARDNSAMVVLQGDDKEVLTVWVLNPHILFSCNAVQKVKAVKVLFQTKAVDEAVGEIDLPDAVVKDVRETLQTSTDFLPPGEKSMKRPRQEDAWNVGFLQRL
ncbi:hypothetical protein N0V82_009986 [Gnomoniopsis sp. IMI 355080]|nr:hypothetical protein N0V82_009986 [Gnomoniopsis sp. IMI 355080]